MGVCFTGELLSSGRRSHGRRADPVPSSLQLPPSPTLHPALLPRLPLPPLPPFSLLSLPSIAWTGSSALLPTPNPLARFLTCSNIKGFMIQTGDPTGTGKGGQSIWGKPFADEVRGTLKVSRAYVRS